MQNRQTKITNRFMLIEFILCAIIIFCNLASKPTIVSNSFTVSFIVLAVFAIYKLSKKEKYYLYGNMFSILLVSGMCVLINSFAQGAWLSFGGLRNYFMFCSTIIFMFLMLNIETDKKIAKKILIFNIFVAALYPVAYKFFPHQISHNALTLNFSNPNLTGMWILQSLLYLLLAVILLKSKMFKLLALLLFVINMFLLNETGARNCMIAIFLFVVICIWVLIKQRPSFSKRFIGIINIIPITFIFVYLKFIDLVKDSGIFDFLISEGKTLTSRVEIWQRNLRKIEDCWLIGSYYTAAGNTHNAHLVILGSFGAITLVLSIYFMHKLCCMVNDMCQTKKSLYCLAAFFAVIFMGIGEGALFSGAIGLYIMACGFIYLARCDFEKE